MAYKYQLDATFRLVCPILFQISGGKWVLIRNFLWTPHYYLESRCRLRPYSRQWSLRHAWGRLCLSPGASSSLRVERLPDATIGTPGDASPRGWVQARNHQEARVLQGDPGARQPEPPRDV